MAKIVLALGIVIGLAILAIAATAEPDSSALMARKGDLHGTQARANMVTKGSCSLHEVALDEGYGVTRTVVRKVCHIDD